MSIEYLNKAYNT